ncbi:apoptosis regulator Bcl-2-like isoform X1 [Limulus polyphemus]|uniref:Apoptosis regulator Bcl-2-like isoform X1 n=1 Tax=Limulus polyphemus TaxID=6850 RepID=A0ABM1BMV2_LIMPO|nr:apoptosis regulator Bcl-2-like isoform X1 [Limulus polyphemus]
MADCNGYRHTLNFESETYVTYLASDYLEFHLRLKGLDSSLYFPSSITNCSNKLTGDKVSMKIRLLGKEMDKHFSEQFTEIRSKLDITTTSLKTAFFGVSNELFSEGITWINIVTLFVFSGEMAVTCIENGWFYHVNNLAHWLASYICNHLVAWIQDHGGWDGLVEYTENREEQRNESSWPVFKRFCGVAAGLGALTLGAFFASKS